MKFLALSLLLFFSVCVSAQIEKVVPPKPSQSDGLVIDYTKTLTDAQKQALNQKLISFDDNTSSQIVVVMMNTTGDYSVEEVGLGIIRSWGVGNKDKNNGIVLLVAKNDHKIRIEVGNGLEGAIPDVTTKSIIDNDLTPNFREENYYRGLDQATDDIIKAAAGEYKAPAGYHKTKGIGLSTIMFLLLIIFFIIAGRGSRGGGGGLMSAGTGFLLGSMLGGGGRGGGGWSGGGGGGFGGFGGGGGGGGGASGGW